MTVPPTTSTAQAAWAPIEQEFGELLTYQEDLERALEQTFSELNQWRTSLTEQQQQLERQKLELESQRQALHLDQQQEVAKTDSTSQQLALTQQELQSVQAELAQMRTAHDLAKRQLADLTREAAGQRPADSTMFDAERTELELELENIRARAAQLSDTLAETRRQFVHERQQWTHERQVLRSEIEELRTREPAAAVAATADLSIDAPIEANTAWRSASSSSSVRQPEDIVLGSVLAQFQKLGGDRRARQKRAS